MMGGAPGGQMMAMMGSPAGAGGTNPTPAVGPANPRVVAILGRVVGDRAIPIESRSSALGMVVSAAPADVAKVTPALVRQLSDPDPAVRRAAIALLSQVVELAPVELPAASPPAK